MAEVRCPICFQPITLESDISATPCAHLFHTICIKNNYQEKGRFVCYQCESNAIWSNVSHSKFQFGKNIELKEIAKIDFKTADEINTFTERMKKIDSDTWINFKENGKIVEEKMQGMMSYAQAGQNQADQAQTGHAKAGYAPANHDNLKIASKENCKAFEERMLNMKISDEKNPDRIISYGNTYLKLPNGQGYKLVTQSNKRGTESEGIRRAEKSDVANLDDFLDEPRAAEPLEDEGYAHEGHTLADHALAGHAHAGPGHTQAGPGQIQLDKAKLDDFLARYEVGSATKRTTEPLVEGESAKNNEREHSQTTLSRENLHAVDISTATYLPPSVNVDIERSQIFSLNPGIDKMTYEKALKEFEKRGPLDDV